jgi:hypothetical protein
VGTLALAFTERVVLSAHMDGSLVVWHAAMRARAAHLHSLPLLECVALTSRLGVVSCYEKHIVFCVGRVGVLGEDEDEEEDERSFRRREKGDSKGSSKGGKGRRRKPYVVKGARLIHY